MWAPLRETKDDADYDYQSDPEIDGLDTSPVPADRKRKMVADWIVSQSRKRGPGGDTDSHSNQQSGDVGSLQRSPQDDEALGPQDPFDIPVTEVADADPIGRSEMGDSTCMHEKETGPDGFHEGDSMPFDSWSTRSSSQKGEAVPQRSH